MAYTVQQLARLAGVSARALRYYDQIGLLSPARAANGYRAYGQAEVDTLQQILFYRELGVPLEQVAALLRDPAFDRRAALRGHREDLLRRREQLDRLIANVQRSIAAEEGGSKMQDLQKFEGFKRELVEQNERQYGAEAREAYGDSAVDAAGARLMGLTQEQYAEMEHLGAQVLRLLDEAFAAGDAHSETAKRLAETHKQWLLFSWTNYSPQAHRGLADLYVADERFAAYYDRGVPGKAQFLRDAIANWLAAS